MKIITSLAIVVALVVAGCGGSGKDSSSAATQPTRSINQLQHEAAAEHEVAQSYLRQTMQLVREGKSNSEHAKAVRLINLERAAQSRAHTLHRQMCERVLQIPNVLPGNGHLARTAYTCELQGFR
jgi:predicted secreted protein